MDETPTITITEVLEACVRRIAILQIRFADGEITLANRDTKAEAMADLALALGIGNMTPWAITQAVWEACATAGPLPSRAFGTGAQRTIWLGKVRRQACQALWPGYR